MYQAGEEKNNLFPVFLKLQNFRVLIVGAGAVGFEKLKAVLDNSPETKITIVGKEISKEIKLLAGAHQNILLYQKIFERNDLMNQDIVIVALNDRNLSKQVRDMAHKKRLWVNVSDTPELCDFYLGSIVQKGQIKIAISTNGKSPTMAKRLKEVLQQAIPDTINEVAKNLHIIRMKLCVSFKEKVEKLYTLTKVLVEEETEHSQHFK